MLLTTASSQAVFLLIFMRPIPLHIFNPDTDYARATDGMFYTPPAKVVELRAHLSLLPALYASEGDAILLPSECAPEMAPALPYYEQVALKRIELITWEQLEKAGKSRVFIPTPWGWDLPLWHKLESVSESLTTLPPRGKIELIRKLSHRRTTIEFLREYNRIASFKTELPREYTRTEEAIKEWQNGRTLFYKTPWSSSGRGIMFTEGLERKHIEPWLRGSIRSQGSVIAETAYCKKLDYASEWSITPEGNVEYLGLSLFETSPRGKYLRNHNLSQSEINERISESSSGWNKEIIKAQKSVLSTLIAPYYAGPLGIDMLTTQDGEIIPCIEINLRRTMGMTGFKI